MLFKERVNKRWREILSPSRLYRVEKYWSIFTLFDNEVSTKSIQSIPLDPILQIKKNQYTYYIEL